MLLSPSSAQKTTNPSSLTLEITDTLVPNIRPGRNYYLYQLFFAIRNNTGDTEGPLYDARIALNGEIVALLSGCTGIAFRNIGNSDITYAGPTQHIITYTPPVPLLLTDNIVFDAILTSIGSTNWGGSGAHTFSYMLNIGEQ